MKKQKKDKVFEILGFIQEYFEDNYERIDAYLNKFSKTPFFSLDPHNHYNGHVKLLTLHILKIGYYPIKLSNQELFRYFPMFMPKYFEGFPNRLKDKFCLSKDQVKEILDISFFWAGLVSEVGSDDMKQRIPKGQPPAKADNKYKTIAYILKTMEVRCHKGIEASACGFINIKPSALSKWKGGTDSKGKKNFDKFLQWKNETPIDVIDKLGPLTIGYIDNTQKPFTLQEIQEIISQLIYLK